MVDLISSEISCNIKYMLSHKNSPAPIHSPTHEIDQVHEQIFANPFHEFLGTTSS